MVLARPNENLEAEGASSHWGRSARPATKMAHGVILSVRRQPPPNIRSTGKQSECRPIRSALTYGGHFNAFRGRRRRAEVAAARRRLTKSLEEPGVGPSLELSRAGPPIGVRGQDVSRPGACGRRVTVYHPFRADGHSWPKQLVIDSGVAAVQGRDVRLCRAIEKGRRCP